MKAATAYLPPRTDLDRAVLEILSRRYDAISVEHICGGGYLTELTEAVAEIHGVHAPAVSPQEIIEKGKPVTLCVATYAKSEQTPLSQALPIWRWSAARVAALSWPAASPAICQLMADEETIARFANVWPEGDFLQHIPIRLLVNPLAPLVGAAAITCQSEK